MDFIVWQGARIVATVMVARWHVPLHKSMSWWRHQMDIFSRYWPFVRGIHRSSVNSPHKGQWRGALMFSLICAWINGWVNNHEAGDLGRHNAYYDVTVMWNGGLFSLAWPLNYTINLEQKATAGHLAVRLCTTPKYTIGHHGDVISKVSTD